MAWQSNGSGWKHPQLGTIAQLPDGKWEVTNPAGEVLEPFDELDVAKGYQEGLWSGWTKDGEAAWNHQRFGRISKSKDGSWAANARPDADIGLYHRGQFDRTGFAIFELLRLAPLVTTIRVLGVIDSVAYIALVALSGLLFTSVLSLAAAAVLISVLRIGLEARGGWHKSRYIQTLVELVVYFGAWWFAQKWLPNSLAHLRPSLVAPFIGVAVFAALVRLLSLIAFAVLSATGPRRGVSRAVVPEWMRPQPPTE